jgi:glycosyltransferase involved in cell wall biosynthesis
MKTVNFKQSQNFFNALSKDDLPLVSFIVPVYNTQADLLRRCISSITGQTYSNIEIIIVDDGSNAETANAIDEIAKGDSRIQTIFGGHKGVSHARNVGMDQAQGQWIAFADSDDEYVPAFTEEALAIALHQDCDLVCGYVKQLKHSASCGSLRSDENVYLVGTPVHKDSEIDVLAAQMIAPAKHKKFNGPDFCGRGPVAKLYKTAKLRDFDFDENIEIGEDALFNYFYIESSFVVSVVQREWYLYFQYLNSSSHSSELRKWINSVDGIFKSGSRTNDLTPFQARCAFMSFQFIECLANEGAFEKYKDDAKTLLIHVANQGCFNSQVIDSYMYKPWLKHMYKLCESKRWTQACKFWCFKTKTAAVLKSK